MTPIPWGRVTPHQFRHAAAAIYLKHRPGGCLDTVPLSQFLTLLGRVAAEADQPGLRRVQRQFERAHSFLQVVQESLRLMLMLKADNGVIRIADGNHVAGRVSAPAMGPEIEHVVQVDVRSR
jgi:hypothetical protein